jgi:hypothetical protein
MPEPLSEPGSERAIYDAHNWMDMAWTRRAMNWSLVHENYKQVACECEVIYELDPRAMAQTKKLVRMGSRQQSFQEASRLDHQRSLFSDLGLADKVIADGGTSKFFKDVDQSKGRMSPGVKFTNVEL